MVGGKCCSLWYLLFVFTILSPYCVLTVQFYKEKLPFQLKYFQLKMAFFQNTSFKLKLQKTVKTSWNCRIKICQSVKQKATWNIAGSVFYSKLCSFCCLKNDLPTNRRFPILCQKPTELPTNRRFPVLWQKPTNIFP